MKSTYEELETLLIKRDEEIAVLRAAQKSDFEIFHAMRMKLSEACGDPYLLHDEALEKIIEERNKFEKGLKEVIALSRPILRCGDNFPSYANINEKIINETATKFIGLIKK